MIRIQTGHATVPSNLSCWSWLDQRIVDNQPALPPVRARTGPHPLLHFCKRQMGCRMGHSCHICFSSCAHPVHSMLLHKPDGWFTHEDVGISLALGVSRRLTAPAASESSGSSMWNDERDCLPSLPKGVRTRHASGESFCLAQHLHRSSLSGKRRLFSV